MTHVGNHHFHPSSQHFKPSKGRSPTSQTNPVQNAYPEGPQRFLLRRIIITSKELTNRLTSDDGMILHGSAANSLHGSGQLLQLFVAPTTSPIDKRDASNARLPRDEKHGKRQRWKVDTENGKT